MWFNSSQYFDMYVFLYILYVQVKDYIYKFYDIILNVRTGVRATWEISFFCTWLNVLPSVNKVLLYYYVTPKKLLESFEHNGWNSPLNLHKPVAKVTNLTYFYFLVQGHSWDRPCTPWQNRNLGNQTLWCSCVLNYCCCKVCCKTKSIILEMITPTTKIHIRNNHLVHMLACRS